MRPPTPKHSIYLTENQWTQLAVMIKESYADGSWFNKQLNGQPALQKSCKTALVSFNNQLRSKTGKRIFNDTPRNNKIIDNK